MKNSQSAPKSKKIVFSIISWGLMFLGFIFIFSSFMNRTTLNKYSESGISAFAIIEEISSYKKKMSKKSAATTSIMVRVNITLRGLSSSTFLSEFISEEEADTLKEGQRVEILYLPKSDFVYNNKLSFVTAPIMKKTLENAFEVNKNYIIAGVIGFFIGLMFLIIGRFFK